MKTQNIKTGQSGFTLIELVMVIVILGILAAVAIPKFADLSGEARSAAVNATAGAIRASVVIVEATYTAIGAGTSPVTLKDGTTVAVATTATAGGIPTGVAGGIGAAFTLPDSFTAVYTVPDAVTFRPTVGGSATCGIVYNGTTGLVTATTTGC